MQGKALPGFAGYLQRKAAMHPSVTFGDTSPCRGGFTNGCRSEGAPLQEAAELSAAPKAPLEGELSANAD